MSQYMFVYCKLQHSCQCCVWRDVSQTCDLVVARTASGSSDQPEVELFVNDIPVSVPPGTTVLQVTLATTDVTVLVGHLFGRNYEREKT